MGKGGGGSRPAGPTPEQVAQAQIDAQRREQERVTAERNTNAGNFISNNAISDNWRSDIANRSQGMTDQQLGMLDQQHRQSIDDIRQRQSGRGLGNSSTMLGLNRQAGTLLDQSRNDIVGAGERRVSDRISQQDSLLNRAANAIRGGTPVSMAENTYQTDIENANKSFDMNLRNAGSQDQRNRAFLDFESRRQQSAAKFKESIGRMEDDSLLAARAIGQSSEEEKDSAGQGFGTSTTNII